MDTDFLKVVWISGNQEQNCAIVCPCKEVLLRYVPALGL